MCSHPPKYCCELLLPLIIGRSHQWSYPLAWLYWRIPVKMIWSQSFNFFMIAILHVTYVMECALIINSTSHNILLKHALGVVLSDNALFKLFFTDLINLSHAPLHVWCAGWVEMPLNFYILLLHRYFNILNQHFEKFGCSTSEISSVAGV